MLALVSFADALTHSPPLSPRPKDLMRLKKKLEMDGFVGSMPGRSERERREREGRREKKEVGRGKGGRDRKRARSVEG